VKEESRRLGLLSLSEALSRDASSGSRVPTGWQRLYFIWLARSLGREYRVLPLWRRRELR